MRATAKFSCVCVLAAGLSAGLTAMASGQTYTATLTGTVSDPNGAVVPNTKIVATNQGTKIEYAANSNDLGVYTIRFLPIGEEDPQFGAPTQMGVFSL